MKVSDLPWDERFDYSEALGRIVSLNETVDMKVYRGCSAYGIVECTISGDGEGCDNGRQNTQNVYDGASSYGPVRYCRQGNYIYEGCTPYGPIKYCIEGNKVYEGCTPYGPVKYCIEGNRVYEGCTPYGPVLFTLD